MPDLSYPATSPVVNASPSLRARRKSRPTSSEHLTSRQGKGRLRQYLLERQDAVAYERDLRLMEIAMERMAAYEATLPVPLQRIREIERLGIHDSTPEGLIRNWRGQIGGIWYIVHCLVLGDDALLKFMAYPRNQERLEGENITVLATGGKSPSSATHLWREGEDRVSVYRLGCAESELRHACQTILWNRAKGDQ